MSSNLNDTSIPLAEISQEPSAFEKFLDRNQKTIFALAAILVICAAGTVVYRAIQTSEREDSGAALSKAASVSDFQLVISTYPTSAAAGSAMVGLANLQWTAGNRDDSVATLRKFVSEFPAHPAFQSAKSSLACKLLSQGKTEDASSLFEEIAADSSASFITPFALVTLGDIAKSAGDLAKAETYYAKVESFGESEFATTAKARIASLKAKAPVEIEAPTPPPTAEAMPATPSPLMPTVSPKP